MKIIFIARQGLDANFFHASLSSLLKNSVSDNELVWVTETGVTAKKAKLKRSFKGKTFFSKTQTFIDLAMLQIYHQLMTLNMKRIMSTNLKSPSSKLVIPDVNNPQLVQLIEEENPDWIFNYGTAIYSEHTLANINKPIINIHSGRLPKYRNVHTDFWAYLEKDYKSIGITLFYLNSGIDTGKLVSWTPAELNLMNPTLSGYKVANLFSALHAITEVIEGRFAHQDESENLDSIGPLWPTPKLKDLLKLFFQSITS